MRNLASCNRLSPELDQALLHGASLGGARPKVLLDDGGRKFIAKFSASHGARARAQQVPTGVHATESGHLGGTTPLVREPDVSQKRRNIDTFCGHVTSIDIS